MKFINYYYNREGINAGEIHYKQALATAKILSEYTTDENTLLATLMKDIINQTNCSRYLIALQFNPVVQRIVEGVSCVDTRLESAKRLQLSCQENILKLTNVKDERILYIKLADRLHNMRTITGHVSLAKKKKIAEETLHFFVPMASRLGLAPMAKELKERSLVVLNHQ